MEFNIFLEVLCEILYLLSDANRLWQWINDGFCDLNVVTKSQFV